MHTAVLQQSTAVPYPDTRTLAGDSYTHRDPTAVVVVSPLSRRKSVYGSIRWC